MNIYTSDKHHYPYKLDQIDYTMRKRCPLCGCTKHYIFGCHEHWLKHDKDQEEKEVEKEDT